MEIDLRQVKIPPIFVRDGRDCYLDPVREKLIFITPEETIRQKVVNYLMNALSVPKEMIMVEVKLSLFGSKSKGRADILVLKYDKEQHANTPLVVIECKAPGVLLGDKAIEQMVHYADELVCDYCMLTDGATAFCYHYNENNESYEVVEELPKYLDMVKGQYVRAPEWVQPPREKFEDMIVAAYSYVEVGYLGSSTPNYLLHPAANLLDAFLYTEHRLAAKQYKLFRVLEDYGIRFLSYGNQSGGNFQGPYRSFLIDYKGSTEFVSFGFSDYVTSARPDNIRSCMMVAIDNEEQTHQSVEYVIDDNLAVLNDKVTFYHHGKIGISNIGSGKVAELREYVAKSYPEILSGNKFCLGMLRYDRLWTLDDPAVEKLVENFISYALIRDEYRKFVKDKAKK